MPNLKTCYYRRRENTDCLKSNTIMIFQDRLNDNPIEASRDG